MELSTKHEHQMSIENVRGSSVSMFMRSFEKREMMRPMGVVSKNSIGAASTERIRPSCSTRDATTPNSATLRSRKYVETAMTTAVSRNPIV